MWIIACVRISATAEYLWPYSFRFYCNPYKTLRKDILIKSCALQKSTVQHEMLTKSVIFPSKNAFCEPRLIGRSREWGLEKVRKGLNYWVNAIICCFWERDGSAGAGKHISFFLFPLPPSLLNFSLDTALILTPNLRALGKHWKSTCLDDIRTSKGNFLNFG